MALRLKGPKGSSNTLGFHGEQYTADEDGVFTVPDEAVNELKSHGFVPAPAAFPKKKEDKKEHD